MKDFDDRYSDKPRDPHHPGQFKLFAYTILLYVGLIVGVLGAGAVISLCISLGALAGEERVASASPVDKRVVKSVDILRVYDGDTFYIRAPECVDTFLALCAKIGVRVSGVDAPEMHGKCESERQAAVKAQQVVASLLGNAHSIVLTHMHHEKYGRLLADVEVDGLDLKMILLANGLARPYDGGARTGWCKELLAT